MVDSQNSNLLPPDAIGVTVDELLQTIGELTVQVRVLKKQNESLQASARGIRQNEYAQDSRTAMPGSNM